jgi:hypothetical protein
VESGRLASELQVRQCTGRGSVHLYWYLRVGQIGAHAEGAVATGAGCLFGQVVTHSEPASTNNCYKLIKEWSGIGVRALCK